MTNFEIITKNSKNLSEFIDMVVEDALEAEGCSLYLTMPDSEYLKTHFDFQDWFEQEAEGIDVCYTSKGAIYG